MRSFFSVLYVLSVQLDFLADQIVSTNLLDKLAHNLKFKVLLALPVGIF
jgi:hypothetical protein